MSLFQPRCPMCQDFQWQSYAKDENGINLLIQCLTCGTIRERITQPVENFREASQ